MTHATQGHLVIKYLTYRQVTGKTQKRDNSCWHNVHQHNTFCFDDIMKHKSWYTAKSLKDMKNKTIIMSIEQEIWAYNNRGFIVCTILGDGQFKYIQQWIENKDISMNICTADEHNPKIERYTNSQRKGVCNCHNPTNYKISNTSDHWNW